MLAERALELRRAHRLPDVKVGLVRDDPPAFVREEAGLGIREMIRLQHELTQAPVVPVLIASAR